MLYTCNFNQGVEFSKYRNVEGKTISGPEEVEVLNGPFPHSASECSNNSISTRLEWTFCYIYCIFVHPDFVLVLSFLEMWDRSIATVSEIVVTLSLYPTVHCDITVLCPAYLHQGYSVFSVKLVLEVFRLISLNTE